MLNLNNVPADDNSNQQREFELIPDNTTARAIIKLSGGDIQLPEFGDGAFFKQSQSTNAKWLPMELTIVGGQFDKRKIWQNLFVDGNKLSDRGVPVAKEIGMRTLRSIIDSAFGLSSKDDNPQAQQARNLSGVSQLQGLEVCIRVGIEKGSNGYSDKNKVKAFLTADQNGYIAGGQQPVQQQPMQQQPMQQAQTMPTATAGVVPQWGR
jgi:hypothetical protein